MDSLERLIALEEIKDLKARYCRFVDLKLWDEFEQLFLPDATFEAPQEGLSLMSGAHAFRLHAEASHHECVVVHHCHTPEIRFLAPDSAQGIWAMQDILKWKDGAQTVHGYKEILGWGHYHESYRKVAGEWRIASMKLTRVRQDFTAQEGEARRALTTGERAIWSHQ
jgi:hypothetical protein